MKNSFNNFKLKVQQLCSPEDYTFNHEMLNDLPISSYQTFLSLLKLGFKIKEAVDASSEIYKLSISTLFTQQDLVYLISKLPKIPDYTNN